jgi:uncharacterized protein (TIGR02466 family)
MDLDNWFPSTIGKEEHPDWLAPMTELVDGIFNVPDKDVNDTFYYNGETTHGKRSLVAEPEFQPFVNFIIERAKHFLDIQGFDADKVMWRPYVFANSFKEGSNHPKHLHSGCTISGIYYLKTPPGSSKIVFYPNQPFKDFFDYMYYLKPGSNWYSMQSVEYTPHPGLLLLWPAWLYHEVPPNHSTDPRTSIVFNL